MASTATVEVSSFRLVIAIVWQPLITSSAALLGRRPRHVHLWPIPSLCARACQLFRKGPSPSISMWKLDSPGRIATALSRRWSAFPGTCGPLQQMRKGSPDARNRGSTGPTSGDPTSQMTRLPLPKFARRAFWISDVAAMTAPRDFLSAFLGPDRRAICNEFTMFLPV